GGGAAAASVVVGTGATATLAARAGAAATGVGFAVVPAALPLTGFVGGACGVGWALGGGSGGGEPPSGTSRASRRAVLPASTLRYSVNVANPSVVSRKRRFPAGSL